jgi:hypothetical protein
VHFGVGKNKAIKTIEIRWPSGQIDTLNDLAANQLVTVKEGAGIVRKTSFKK